MLYLYYSFIFPYLFYCCSAWGSTNKFLLRSLQRAENSTVKATFFLARLYHFSDLYNDNEIVPVDLVVGKNKLYLPHLFTVSVEISLTDRIRQVLFFFV